MYLSLIITTILYVAIAIGVYGMLPLEEVIAAGNTAIATAAEPILGSAGFVIMTICACFSTSSAVNSQFFATTGVIAYLAKIGRFPSVLWKKAGKNGNLGIAISTVVVSIMTMLFDLSAVASIGSAVALMIFMMVGIAHVRFIKETGANLFIIYLSIFERRGDPCRVRGRDVVAGAGNRARHRHFPGVVGLRGLRLESHSGSEHRRCRVQSRE